MPVNRRVPSTNTFSIVFEVYTAKMGYMIDTSYITPGGMLAAAIVPAVLAIVAVALRFYVRRTKTQPILWDDWLLIPGVVRTLTSTRTLHSLIASSSGLYDRDDYRTDCWCALTATFSALSRLTVF